MLDVRISALLACLIAPGVGEVKAADDDTAFFESKIVPLLESRCFKCHSHASGKMKAGLTLDSRSGWAEGGESGPAIIPSNPDKSLLIQAVRHTNPDLEMPPDEKLPDSELALFIEWVKRGAPDPRQLVSPGAVSTDWWSLKPLVEPEVPGGGHPIDAFVRVKLAEAGIEPAPAADRRTLIRRLSYDLHGVPPTPEAVEAFVADPDPSAFEKLVDRLLESPRYGERWARHWLDVIHFADSHGCEHDVKRPNAWRFRDYVIDRFNEDVSWEHFIREQLAADAYYPAESDLTAALGFLAAGPLELSRAGTAPVTFDYLDRDDMVTQTMAAFASTTANCARCHTHKFDPITQEDYYALQAVFAGVGKGDVKYDADPEVADRRGDLEWMVRVATKDKEEWGPLFSDYHRETIDAAIAWFGKDPASWEPLEVEEFLSAEGSTLTREPDGSIFAGGARPDKDTYTITAGSPLRRLSAIRLEVLGDDRLPMKGPGRQENGNLHLSEFEARVLEPGSEEPVILKFRKATADWNQDGWTIEHALDSNLGTAWGIFPKVGESHQAAFELDEPIELKPGSRVEIALRQLHGAGHLIGRFRLFATAGPPEKARVFSPAVTGALKVPPNQRSDEQSFEITACALGLYAEKLITELPEQAAVYAVSAFWSRAKKLNAPQEPKVVHLLRRGDIESPVREVPPGALSAIFIPEVDPRFRLEESDGEIMRRASLAGWLASHDNPLTWRSVVNRVWHYHFGRGICDTPNDFGRMGGEPSHPELLDWLAHWFLAEGRVSLKELHRLILTSETWKQASAVQPSVAARETDAGNRLLWRMNPQRLDAEMFRDSALQLTGRLELAMGGPGVEQFTKSKGQQSTPKLDYSAFDWNSPGASRRSIYRVVWRGIPDPFMEALDFPDLGLLSPKRGFSVSALQSLALFNNDFVLHVSEWFAARLEREEAALKGQVRRAVALALLREPEAGELRDLTNYAETHGLAALCRVLLNSNEFLFVE